MFLTIDRGEKKVFPNLFGSHDCAIGKSLVMWVWLKQKDRDISSECSSNHNVVKSITGGNTKIPNLGAEPLRHHTGLKTTLKSLVSPSSYLCCSWFFTKSVADLDASHCQYFTQPMGGSNTS